VTERPATIHPDADVDASATIGPSSTVGRRAEIRAGAVIGSRTDIGADVLVGEDVAIGDGVQVERGALLYRGITIADDVFVGPGAILTNDRYPRAVTTSGDLAAAGAPATPVALEAGCSIGAGAVLVAGVTIGTYATVGAGAVVTRDVPSHALVVGSPARRIGWVCACGARLVDAEGHPAEAVPPPYAAHRELLCSSCDRVYAYIPDAETLEERPAAKRAN
jgi:UDP-2-acetamido-3-amino-2,3-dideoxy-glucuronate N-acetyltransferase